MDPRAKHQTSRAKSALLLHALQTLILVFLLAYVSLSLSTQSHLFTPLWFPTAGIIIMLYPCPARQWPLLLLLSGLGIYCANFILFGSNMMAAKLTLINLLEASLSLYLLRQILPTDDPLNNLTHWLKFIVCAVLFFPLISALLATILVYQPEQEFWLLFTTWFISKALGILALVPVYHRSALTTLRLSEMLLTLIGTLVLIYLALTNLPYPFTFVTVSLFWAAIRLPRLETLIIFFAITLMFTMMVSFESPHFQVIEPYFSNVSIYLPLLLILLPAQTMAIVIHALRIEKAHLIESETRFRHALKYSVIGMALMSPEGKWLQVNEALCKLLRYSRDDLHHMAFQQLTHPDDLPPELIQLQALLDGKISSYTRKKRCLRSDGVYIWITLSVSLVRNQQGDPLYFIAQMEDIDELKRSEEENQRLIERITLANQAGGIGIWEWKFGEDSLTWDRRMFELYELPPGETPTRELWRSLLLPEDRSYIDQQLAKIPIGCSFTSEFRIKTPLGTLRHIRAQGEVILDSSNQPIRMIGTNVDWTKIKLLTKALHEEKERLRITLDAIGEGVISINSEMRITFMNPIAEQMSGWSSALALGMPINSVIRLTQDLDGAEIENPAQHCLQQGGNRPEDPALVLHSRDGRRIDVQLSVSPLKTLEGENAGAVMVLQDVSDSRKLMKKLSYNASHDALTKLQNRASFEQQLERAIVNAADDAQHHALVFLDLDRFKAVNDSAGHAAGDALLKEISQLMQSQLRNSDCLARLGGDEFGLILFDCSLEQAHALLQKIVLHINEYPFLWEGKTYHVGASAGITQITATSGTSTELLAQADLACYSAKHRGRGQVYLYQPD